ncbi:MAG: hypothetical protein ACOVPA_02800 [Rubrivivax sp.]
MSAKLQDAARAVLARWDSPQWEWSYHGPTAGLMADLRAALAADEAREPLSQRIGCLCGPDFWLMCCSGGAAAEGLYGRVTLCADGKAQDYAKAGPPRDLLVSLPKPEEGA